MVCIEKNIDRYLFQFVNKGRYVSNRKLVEVFLHMRHKGQVDMEYEKQGIGKDTAHALP